MQKRKKMNITDAEKKENEYYRCRKRLKYVANMENGRKRFGGIEICI